MICSLLATGIGLNAASIVPSLCSSGWWSLKSDEPFVKPLEDVSVPFDCPIKIVNDQKIEVICDGLTVAKSVSAEVLNDKTLTGYNGTLVIHFDKLKLPKGKTYSILIHEGTVGRTESDSDIQIVNMEMDMSFSIPENLGKPGIHADDQIPDSKISTVISWPYEITAVGDARFLLYREGEKIGEYPLEISNWPSSTSYIKPAYNEYITFEPNVRYSLVLPAGSVGSMYRDDITNDEIKIDFTGCYEEPSLAFSYIWCSWYTDHSDILGEISFTYDRPIALTDEARVQLWEEGCETLVKEVIPHIDTDVNCWLLVADFGGIPLTSEKGYTIVIPNGALVAADESGATSVRSQLNINNGSAGTEDLIIDTSMSEPQIYDLYGRRVLKPASGSIYIQNGKKFVHH